MKLSKTQVEALRCFPDMGRLVKVYASAGRVMFYWQHGGGAGLRAPTIERLRSSGFIAIVATDSNSIEYAITPAGREYLAQLEE
jgi:hypothetical protein